MKQRELKFRAWVREGEWDENDDRRKFVMIDGDSFCIPEAFEPLCDLMKNTDDCFIMQFTGLKDKNGVEIYEGDILKDTEFDEEGNDISGYYPVVYDHKTCQFCIDNSFKKDGSHLVNIIAYFGIDNIEVVGNIYETPELLPCGSIYGCH